MSWLACLSLALMAFGSSQAANSDGWVSVAGRYLKYYAKPETFVNAHAICVKQGGDLVYDDNPGVSAHLERRGGIQWIGATDVGHEGSWTWMNDVYIGKAKWGPGQPDNYHGGQHCALTNWGEPGRWDDGTCSVKLPFHCQVQQPGYTYAWRYDHHRVFKVNTDKKTWPEAQSTCFQEGGELVIVDQPLINAWLAKQAPNDMWIGATDVAKESIYTWLDGTRVTNTYWSQNGHNCAGQNCAVVNYAGNKGKWNDRGCNTINPFVCQIRF